MVSRIQIHIADLTLVRIFRRLLSSAAYHKYYDIFYFICCPTFKIDTETKNEIYSRLLILMAFAALPGQWQSAKAHSYMPSSHCKFKSNEAHDIVCVCVCFFFMSYPSGERGQNEIVFYADYLVRQTLAHP